MTNIIAHRGFSGMYPENTLLAFQNAVELGVDGIELDVHLSRDKQVVVIHDENLERVAGRRDRVQDLSAAELAQAEVRGGSLDVRGQTVPTLEQYFRLVRDKGVFTNIELKNSLVPYKGLEREVLELVEVYGLQGRVLISSFNHHSLAKVLKLSPGMRCACLTACRLERGGEYAKTRGFSFVNPHYLSLDDESIAEIHGAGVGIQAWTVDKPAPIQYLCLKGVYGVITNWPDQALIARKQALVTEVCTI
jgi:glycerophosphoryl diester phosphodiesterase